MCHAVRVVRSGEMGYLRASKYFPVPRETLERYVKDTSRSPEELVDVHLGRRTVLTSELKNELVEYCIIMDQRYYVLRCRDIKHMAFQLAIGSSLNHPFNKKKISSWEKMVSIPFKKASNFICENS
jgi:hypothetical protein